MKTFRTLIFVSCLFATYAAALGGIRPSFQAEESAWLATDIVVVTEGKDIDGVVQVTETLKGDLKPGATLTLPELTEFKAREARLFDNDGFRSPRPDRFVTGNRMILFLRDQTKIPADDEEQDDFFVPEPKQLRWTGANPMARDIKYSTAWIEGEEAYAFYQLVNPGPSLLCSTSLKEADLRKKISDVTSEQTAFNAAVAVVDPSDRAEALRPFIHSSKYLVRQTAFKELTDCGSAALPVLRAELESDINRGALDYVVEALAAAGRREAGPILTKFLARELVFWKLLAPTLDSGWWNGAGFGSVQMEAIKAAEPIRNRWSTLLHTVYALRAIRYTESAHLVAELSELWRSLPQMNNDQVAQACDDYFRTVGRKAIGSKRLRLPRYEIHFYGNKVFSSEELMRKMAEYMAQYDELEKDYKGDIGSGIFSYALRQLSVFYGSRGYVYADVRSDQYTSDQGEIISVVIDEGKQYRMCELKIAGAKRISSEHIRATFPLRTGDIVNEALIDKWTSDLEQSYSKLGYLSSYVVIEHEPRSNLQAEPVGGASDTMLGEFKVKITEQEQFTVRSIKFNGKSKYSEDQLASAVSLRSGGKFTEASLKSGIRKLNEQFGLELDREKDVDLLENNRTDSVTVVIYLNRDRPPKDSFGRWTHRLKWSL